MYWYGLFSIVHVSWLFLKAFDEWPLTPLLPMVHTVWQQKFKTVELLLQMCCLETSGCVEGRATCALRWVRYGKPSEQHTISIKVYFRQAASWCSGRCCRLSGGASPFCVSFVFALCASLGFLSVLCFLSTVKTFLLGWPVILHWS